MLPEISYSASSPHRKTVTFTHQVAEVFLCIGRIFPVSMVTHCLVGWHAVRVYSPSGNASVLWAEVGDGYSLNSVIFPIRFHNLPDGAADAMRSLTNREDCNRLDSLLTDH
nr:hypothetical protein [Escherichia coli]